MSHPLPHMLSASETASNRLNSKFTSSLDALSRCPYLVFFLTVLPIMIVYLPALGIYLRTDDFEWLNESYTAWAQPLVFFKLIGGFFRPVVKLSYVLNYSLFGKAAAPYALVTVLIHLGNLFLIYVLVRRQTKKVFPAAAVIFFFGISSYYSEITLWAAARPDSLLLFFVLLLLLFSSRERFAPGWKSQALILFLGLGAAGSKEAWVVFPFLVFFYLVLVTRLTPKHALGRLRVFFILLFLYFLFPLLKLQVTGVQGIFHYSRIHVTGMPAKAGFLICKFLGLSDFYTGSVWQSSLVIACGLLVFLLALLRKNRLALWGLLWMGGSMVQVLIVDFLPSRYNYLPLLGFWIAVTAFVAAEIPGILKSVNGTAVRLAAAAAILFYGMSHAVILHRDIGDYRANGLEHRQLVRMFERIGPGIPRHLPFLVVNLGRKKSVWEFRQSVRGQNKLLFSRDDALWQLVYPDRLANFSGRPFAEQVRIMPRDQWPKAIGQDFTVLVFSDRGFVVANQLRNGIREYIKKAGALPERTWLLAYHLT